MLYQTNTYTRWFIQPSSCLSDAFTRNYDLFFLCFANLKINVPGLFVLLASISGRSYSDCTTWSTLTGAHLLRCFHWITTMSCLTGAECSGPWETQERWSGGGVKMDKTSQRVWVWNNSYAAGISQEAPDSTNTIPDTPLERGGGVYLTATAWIRATLMPLFLSQKEVLIWVWERRLNDELTVSQWQHVWRSVTCSVRRIAKTLSSFFSRLQRVDWKRAMNDFYFGGNEREQWMWMTGKWMRIKAGKFGEWGKEWKGRDVEEKQAEIDEWKDIIGKCKDKEESTEAGRERVVRRIQSLSPDSFLSCFFY